ncbi:PREDICTED: uncharacterized protein LOC107071411 [Polistes dominula]|uniref:Uncharacterized protein LOC107071411 n=1 Tax=Polistes dominula TaxID=743375 RepID=A0ABM1J094_POLDO|nr:PREDICTED: uncharacterized protein LOC107071411 [Polistes dominula]
MHKIIILSEPTDIVLIGNYLFEKFNPQFMDFLKWLNNFEFMLNIVHLSDDQKVKFLLNLLVPDALMCIQIKVLPANPSDFSYDEIISYCEELFSSYQGTWAANYRFIYRNQFSMERIPDFMLALRKLCSKANPELRSNNALKERFIDGLANKNIQAILRSCSNLTLSRAVAIANNLELYNISTKTPPV